jgi:hypothetical protein
MLPHAAHVISVSSGYVEVLRQRYPTLGADRFTVIPFGAPEHDFELMPTLPLENRIFDPSDGMSHWVSVGRGGPDLFPGLRELFGAIQRFRRQEPKKWRRVRLHFIGTSYSPEGKEAKVVEPIAVEMGVGDIVSEHPLRLPYFEALRLMADADGLLVIGSSDRHYNPSKLFPCLLAKRPVLAVLHRDSSAVNLLSDAPSVRMIRFDGSDNGPASVDSEISLTWFRCAAGGEVEVSYEWPHLREVSARSLTARQCDAFAQAVNYSTRYAGTSARSAVNASGS